MNSELKKAFDRNVQTKADIGFPFTLEDVADTLGVPCNQLRASWLRPFVLSDTLRSIGAQPSRNPAARSRKITVWSGTYYLDLKDDSSGCSACGERTRYAGPNCSQPHRHHDFSPWLERVSA